MRWYFVVCLVFYFSSCCTRILLTSLQNAVPDYTFCLQQNNSLMYTHVEENNCMGIMESSVSTNATDGIGVEVQKIAKHVVGDNSMCIIHWLKW